MAIKREGLAHRRVTVLLFVVLSIASIATQQMSAQGSNAQEVLTNDSIIKLVQANVGESVILEMIQSHPARFSMTTDGIVQLKQQGVPENIISAMIAKGSASSNSAAATGQPSGHPENSPNPSSGPACPSQLGAYYLDGSSWKSMSQVMSEGSSAHVKPIPFATSAKGVMRFRDAAAPITLGESPKFCLRGNTQFSRNIVIAALDVKSDHREIETVHIGQYSGAKTGIPDNKIQPIEVKTLSDSSIEISVRNTLRPGQYMIFPMGQGGMGYDFGVSTVH
jgi:hypothetical protein